MPSLSVLPEASDVKHKTERIPLSECPLRPSRNSPRRRTRSRPPRHPHRRLRSSPHPRRRPSNADRARLRRTRGVLHAVEMSVGACDALPEALLTQPLGHSHRPSHG